jgi:excinuclease ABC subunit B
MIREVGFCNGIENYSRHFDGRARGEPPYTLLDYFPTTSSCSSTSRTSPSRRSAGMYEGDRSRKDTLVEHGFRLPSARDNRPLTFDEFLERIGQRLFISATPGPYERRESTDRRADHPPDRARRPRGRRQADQGQIDDLMEQIRSAPPRTSGCWSPR